MTAALAEAVRMLVTAETGKAAISAEVAAGAQRAFEKLHHHLARIVGEAGMRALFVRTLSVCRQAYPWLPPPGGAPVEAPWSDLSAHLESQSAAVGLEATVQIIATLVGLVARFIGDGLTLRLLGEVWPAIPPAKETL